MKQLILFILLLPMVALTQIEIGVGFDVKSASPLDVRMFVEDVFEREALLTYDGKICYQRDIGYWFQWDEALQTWIPFIRVEGGENQLAAFDADGNIIGNEYSYLDNAGRLFLRKSLGLTKASAFDQSSALFIDNSDYDYSIITQGKVGIGAYEPEYWLDVHGDARIMNALTMNSYVDFTGDYLDGDIIRLNNQRFLYATPVGLGQSNNASFGANSGNTFGLPNNSLTNTAIFGSNSLYDLSGESIFEGGTNTIIGPNNFRMIVPGNIYMDNMVVIGQGNYNNFGLGSVYNHWDDMFLSSGISIGNEIGTTMPTGSQNYILIGNQFFHILNDASLDTLPLIHKMLIETNVSFAHRTKSLIFADFLDRTFRVRGDVYADKIYANEFVGASGGSGYWSIDSINNVYYNVGRVLIGTDSTAKDSTGVAKFIVDGDGYFTGKITATQFDSPYSLNIRSDAVKANGNWNIGGNLVVGDTAVASDSTLTLVGGISATGGIKADHIQLTEGAVDGYMLSTDGAGNAVWIDPVTYTASSGNADSLNSLPASAYALASDLDDYVLSAELTNSYANLIDKTQLKSDTNLHSTTGVFIDGAGYITSHFIELPVTTAGTQYYLQGNGAGGAKRSAWYNASKTLLSYNSSYYNPGIFTVPAGGANYAVIAVFRPGDLNYDEDALMFSLGSSAATYEPFGEYPKYLETQILNDTVTYLYDYIADKGYVDTTFLRTTNLFDLETSTTGFVVGSAGNLSAVTGAITSSFIELPNGTAGTEYYIQECGAGGTKYWGWYNSSLGFISRNTFYNPGIVAVPAGGAAYMRVTVYNPTEAAGFDIRRVMITEGNTAQEFEPYYVWRQSIDYASEDYVGSYVDSLKNDLFRNSYVSMPGDIEFAPTGQYGTKKNRQRSELFREFSTAKNGMLIFRYDNAHAATTEGYYPKLLALHEKYNTYTSLTEVIGQRVFDQGYIHLIPELMRAERAGHEIGMQTVNNSTEYFKIPPGYESIFEPYEATAITTIKNTTPYKTAILKMDRTGVYSDYKIGETGEYQLSEGTNIILGDFSSVTSRNYYIYIDNTIGDKIGWLPATAAGTGSQITVRNIDNTTLSFHAESGLSMYAQPINAVKLDSIATYLLLLAGECWHDYIGLEAPKTFLNAGGVWGGVTNRRIEAAMNRLGWKFANTFDSQDVVLTYNQNRPGKKYSGFGWYTPLTFDVMFCNSDSMQVQKERVADLIAKRWVVTTRSHYAPTENCASEDDWFAGLEDFLKWVHKNKISTGTFSDMVSIVIDGKTDAAVNIIPNLYIDMANQNKPSGWTLAGSTVWVNDDGVAEDRLNSLKLNGNGLIATITALGALEKGINDFNIWIKGTAGATIAVNFTTSTAATMGSPTNIGTATFTIGTSGWNKFNISDAAGLDELIIPYTANFLTMTFTAGNNTSNDIFISGLELRKK